MQSMAKTLTADEILPLVASLTPRGRIRLLRLIALPQGADASVHRAIPPSHDEFSADGNRSRGRLKIGRMWGEAW